MATLLAALALTTTIFTSDPVAITVGESFRLTSKVMGEERNVLVHLPRGYRESAEKYPVLYLTDGDSHARHTSGTIEFLANNGRMPALIVVGVTNTDRTRDLTPAITVENPGFAGGGGADRFLEFFTTELIPYVEANYRTEPYRVLAGHSFGGLFAVNAFLKQPEAFHAYLAVSPSLWWSGESLVHEAAEFFAARKTLLRTLYLTLGSEGERMKGPFDRFLDVLKAQATEGFVWDSKTLPDEDHGSVVLRSHYAGLEKIFEDWAPPRDVQDLATLQAHYQKLSTRIGFERLPPEDRVNALGYAILGAGEPEEAIRVFEWNVAAYPGSANVYDSLGEAEEKSGLLHKAKASYEKATNLARAQKLANETIFRTNFERVSKALEAGGR